MNKTEYVILDENYDRVQAVSNLQEARALAEHLSLIHI